VYLITLGIEQLHNHPLYFVSTQKIELLTASLCRFDKLPPNMSKVFVALTIALCLLAFVFVESTNSYVTGMFFCFLPIVFSPIVLTWCAETNTISITVYSNMTYWNTNIGDNKFQALGYFSIISYPVCTAC
jgi:hypothetical protein